jgi:hypothetical protein
MFVQVLFGISVVFGFVAWAVVTVLYIWPKLQAWSRIEALRPPLARKCERANCLRPLMYPGCVKTRCM